MLRYIIFPILLIVAQQSYTEPRANNRQAQKQESPQQAVTVMTPHPTPQSENTAEAERSAVEKERYDQQAAFQREQLRQNQTVADATFWIAIITGVNLLVAGAFAVIAYYQFKIMRKQAAHTQEQVITMREQLNQTQELFSINILPAITITSAQLENPVNSGAYPIAHLEMTNTGNSVANNVRLNYGRGNVGGDLLTQVKGGQMPDKPPAEQGDTVGIMGPKDTNMFITPLRQWGEGELDSLLTGQRIFHVWGEISYADLLGNRYITQFCLSAQNITIRGLHFSTSHNRIKRVLALGEAPTHQESSQKTT